MLLSPSVSQPRTTVDVLLLTTAGVCAYLVLVLASVPLFGHERAVRCWWCVFWPGRNSGPACDRHTGPGRVCMVTAQRLSAFQCQRLLTASQTTKQKTSITSQREVVSVSEHEKLHHRQARQSTSMPDRHCYPKRGFQHLLPSLVNAGA